MKTARMNIPRMAFLLWKSGAIHEGANALIPAQRDCSGSGICCPSSRTSSDSSSRTGICSDIERAPYPVRTRWTDPDVWRTDLAAAGRLGAEYVKYLVIRGREAVINLGRGDEAA